MIVVISVTKAQLKQLESFRRRKAVEWWECLSDITEHPVKWLKEQIGEGAEQRECRIGELDSTALKMKRTMSRRQVRGLILVTPCLQQDSGRVALLEQATKAASVAELDWT